MTADSTKTETESKSINSIQFNSVQLKEKTENELEIEKSSKIHEKNLELNEFGQPLPKGIALWSCIIALMLANFLVALDIMIVTTIIQTVAQKFDAYSTSGWIVAGYSLPSAAFSLLWSRIANNGLGFKKSMLISIVVFEIGSLICAVANSMNMLIGGRIIAGVGGSGIQSLSFVIASTLVNMRNRGMVVACLGGSFAVASVVGPFLGGAFTTHVTWRWCFYINLPVGGLACILFVMLYNPDGNKFSFKDFKSMSFKVNRKQFSVQKIMKELLFKIGLFEFLLTTAGLTCLLLAFTFAGNKYPYKSYQTIIFFIFGGILIIFAVFYDYLIFSRINFVKANPAKYQPLIPWRLIIKKDIAMANLTVLFYNIGYMGQITYFVQFFQMVYNETAWNASIHLITTLVSTIITIFISGFLTKKFGWVKPVIMVGTTLGFIGSGLLILLDNHSTSAQHIGFLILPGIGFGAITPNILLSAQLALDKNAETFRSDFVTITSLNSFLKNVGPAFGSVVSNAIFDGTAMNQLDKLAQFSQIKSADDLILYRATNFDGATSTLADVISNSCKNVFYLALGWCALAFVLSIFTSNDKVEDERSKIADEESIISD